jgi:hypothetical protein
MAKRQKSDRIDTAIPICSDNLFHTFGFLTTRELCRVRSVCKLFHGVTGADKYVSLWASLDLSNARMDIEEVVKFILSRSKTALTKLVLDDINVMMPPCHPFSDHYSTNRAPLASRLRAHLYQLSPRTLTITVFGWYTDEVRGFLLPEPSKDDPLLEKHVIHFGQTHATQSIEHWALRYPENFHPTDRKIGECRHCGSNKVVLLSKPTRIYTCNHFECMNCLGIVRWRHVMNGQIVQNCRFCGKTICPLENTTSCSGCGTGPYCVTCTVQVASSHSNCDF